MALDGQRSSSKLFRPRRSFPKPLLLPCDSLEQLVTVKHLAEQQRELNLTPTREAVCSAFTPGLGIHSELTEHSFCFKTQTPLQRAQHLKLCKTSKFGSKTKQPDDV